MIERIGCKRCDSPNCKGCNMLTLERMLNSGKFDCLMNENRSIDRNAEVGVVKHGRWIVKNGRIECDQCEALWAVCPNKDVREEGLKSVYKTEKFCYNCGAKMDGEENDNAETD